MSVSLPKCDLGSLGISVNVAGPKCDWGSLKMSVSVSKCYMDYLRNRDILMKCVLGCLRKDSKYVEM